MKKTLVPALIGLLACTLSASAVSITITEDSTDRLDFTVVWGAGWPVTFGPADLNAGAGGVLTVIEFSSGGGIQFVPGFDLSRTPVSSLGAPFTGYFTVRLSHDDPTLASASYELGGDLPDFVYDLDGNPYGARFIYGKDISTGVPDGGSTLLLLAGALGTLGWFKRRFRPARPHVI